MANPYGYWTMFGPGPDPDPDPDPTPTSPDPTPTAPDPVYHSIITGTYDPTPAEIVVAAAASGTPVPPGMDPVEFSRMMSGLPPISIPPSSSLPSSSLASLMTMPVAPTSSSFPLGLAPPSLSGVSGSPLTAAMKAPSFDGGGGILCDPITGKCPQYR